MLSTGAFIVPDVAGTLGLGVLLLLGLLAGVVTAARCAGLVSSLTHLNVVVEVETR